ncbi:hypothetical protein SDC9_198678 [bioreactor metagenome]|uniref:Uncharacterized protein n=1 Tax=bioreactor metagenome TaxID=1076179 RepID=A0A645IIB1_9ZZZZ
MLGLGQNAQLPQLLLQLMHEGGDAGLEAAEIMVIHLLALAGARAEQGAAGIAQVGAL